MRKFTLAAAIPALLLGSFVGAQESQPQPTQPRSTPAQSQSSTNASKAEAPVGTAPSNVDEHATSGSYYPYSAGTVGDDPSEPKTTALPADGSTDRPDSLSERWMAADADGDEHLSKAEFERAWPSLGPRFDEIDVDHDKQLTRDEMRTFHTSQTTRMDADEAATTAPPAAASPATPPPGTPNQ